MEKVEKGWTCMKPMLVLLVKHVYAEIVKHKRQLCLATNRQV